MKVRILVATVNTLRVSECGESWRHRETERGMGVFCGVVRLRRLRTVTSVAEAEPRTSAAMVTRLFGFLPLVRLAGLWEYWQLIAVSDNYFQIQDDDKKGRSNLYL